MSHSMAGNGTETTACQISMLWNWTTMDACFLTESWHVTNRGMFAASCIGISFLAIALEGVRRISRDFDAHLARQLAALHIDDGWYGSGLAAPRRVSALQQAIRAALYMVLVGITYILMLVAMQFNGWVIISILLGAFVGKFLCDWMTLGSENGYGPLPSSPRMAMESRMAMEAKESSQQVI